MSELDNYLEKIDREFDPFRADDIRQQKEALEKQEKIIEEIKNDEYADLDDPFTREIYGLSIPPAKETLNEPREWHYLLIGWLLANIFYFTLTMWLITKYII